MPQFPNLRHALPDRPLAVFGIDLRSLALLRALLGLLLLVDLCGRLGDLHVFYADAGVMPRAWLATAQLSAATGGLWRLNLHTINGSVLFAAALIAMEMIAAVALMLGWRSRLANLVVFVLQASLLNRNPLVLLPGDVLLTCLLFWGLFVPLGARWSVDAALAQTDAPQPASNLYLSWGSAGLLLQVLSVYFFGALLQNGHEWWPDGTALDRLLQLGSGGILPGDWLRSFPQFEQLLSLAVHVICLVGPCLAFLPLFSTPLRAVLLLLFGAQQIGAILFLRLGLWPYANLAALSLLIGSSIWDALARRTQRPQPAPLRIYYDGGCGFCLKAVLLLRQMLILPQAQIATAQSCARADALLQTNHSWVVIDHDDRACLKWPALVLLLKRSPLFFWLGHLLGGGWMLVPGNALYDFIGRHRGTCETIGERLLPLHRRPFAIGNTGQRCAAIILLLLLAWNIGSVQPLPRLVHRVLTPPLQLLRIDQRWDLFAPSPPMNTGWLVIPGELADGSTIDLLHPERAAVSYDTPNAGNWPDPRWRAYYEQLWSSAATANRFYYSRYLCRRWNASHNTAQQLRALKLIYMLETTGLETTGLETAGLDTAEQIPHIEQRVIWRQDCAAAVDEATTDTQPPL